MIAPPTLGRTYRSPSVGLKGGGSTKRRIQLLGAWGWEVGPPTFNDGNPYNKYINTPIIGLMSLSPIIWK